MSPMPPSLARAVAARAPAKIRYSIEKQHEPGAFLNEPMKWWAMATVCGVPFAGEWCDSWDEAAAWCDAHHRELV